MNVKAHFFLFLAVFLTMHCLTAGAAEVTRDEAVVALDKAVGFFVENCSRHGGYVWRYSRDLKLSEGEAETDGDVIWVQPPGTPAVGMALLDAHEATGRKRYLEAAHEAAMALVAGQLQSGGWYYSITFDEKERPKQGYRDNKQFKARTDRKNKTNITTLDDNTTEAAVKFLARVDKVLGFRETAVGESVRFALDAILKAQYPNGAWYQNWDRYPTGHSDRDYPVIPASVPKQWSRKWLNDWPGKYFTNDNVTGNIIDMLLTAYDVYGQKRYLEAAVRCGDFLLLAQMPEPQPAWAQQYDENMHPVWDRRFEPPAISGRESHEVMEALMQIHRRTGDRKYLTPIPRAIEYLRSSMLPGGKLARFYEMGTNKPLYFKRTGDLYELTYMSDDLPTHYAFIFEPWLDHVEAEYKAVLRDGTTAKKPEQITDDELGVRVREIIEQMDARGAWIDSRPMKGFRKASPDGVIQSETFIGNVSLLCRFIKHSSR